LCVVDADERVGVRKRQRPQQDAAEDAEYRGRHPDPEREGDHGKERDEASAYEGPNGMANILNET
jgi:hypothetical protein